MRGGFILAQDQPVILHQVGNGERQRCEIALGQPLRDDWHRKTSDHAGRAHQLQRRENGSGFNHIIEARVARLREDARRSERRRRREPSDADEEDALLDA